MYSYVQLIITFLHSSDHGSVFKENIFWDTISVHEPKYILGFALTLYFNFRKFSIPNPLSLPLSRNFKNACFYSPNDTVCLQL